MGRVLAVSVAVTAVLLATVSPGRAAQCPALVHAVYAGAATRFDTYAHDARTKAAEAARLHREGRHGDAVQLACEGLELLGLRRGVRPCERESPR